jgi:hypothetical protein
MSDERRRRNAKRIAEQLFPVIAKSGGTIRSHFPWDRLPEIINGTYSQYKVLYDYLQKPKNEEHNCSGK